MRIPPRLVPLAALVLFAAAPAAAAQDASEYPQLLARFQAGDTTVDVTALRLAYAQTDAYNPYGDDPDALRSMWDNLDEERYAEAAASAEALLAENWLDINPHFVALVAYDELGNDSAAALHALSLRRLIESIGGPEDGRSPDAPMRVIDTSEEYAYLNVYGLRPSSQSLGSCGGGVRCDMLEVEDEEGKSFTLYFDVTIPFGFLSRSLGGGEGGEKPASPPSRGSRP